MEKRKMEYGIKEIRDVVRRNVDDETYERMSTQDMKDYFEKNKVNLLMGDLRNGK